MILYVRNTQREARNLIQSFNMKNEDVIGIGVGGTIAGYGFDEIIVDVDTTNMSKDIYIRYNKWIKDLRTRLNNPKNIIMFVQ